MGALDAGRPYMSIGDVLNVLKDEFAEVTVSKIRFLESEELIHPERTPTGYRKFSAGDVERLRFILRLQRDHFLPLKVIRERLDQWERSSDSTTLFTAGASPASEDAAATAQAGDAADAVAAALAGALSIAASAQAPSDPDLLVPVLAVVSLSRTDLERASGLTSAELRDLETFGIVTAREGTGAEARYNETDLEAAKLSRELLKLGLEPRHLRMFRLTVDRWTALADQMVLPLVKQRNPDSRRQAADTVRELAKVGNRLLQTLLRDGLRAYHA